MKLAVFTPANSEARYFTQHVLGPLPQCEKILIGLGSELNPLTYFPDNQDTQTCVLHHLVDDITVRTERLLLGAIPGVTIVHNIFMSSHGPEAIINSAFSDTISLFKRALTKFPARSKEYPRDKYYAVRELSLSLLPIFTDPTMHAEFLKRSVGVPNLAVTSAYLPWPVTISYQRHLKRSSEISQFNPLRIGLSCGLRLGGRAHQLMRALSKLHNPQLVKVVWLVPHEKDVSLAREFCAAWPNILVEIKSGRTPESWLELTKTLDVAVHLHFGMFELPGPYLPISLGAGVPCIVSSPAASYLPAGAAIFIRPGAISSGGGEVAELRFAISELLKAERNVNTELALDYVADNHAPQIIQSEFLSLLEDNREALINAQIKLRDLRLWARAELLAEIKTPAVLDDVFSELGWHAQPTPLFKGDTVIGSNA